MNLREYKNASMQLLDLRMRGKRNAIYLGANERLEHALKKAEVCHKLRQEGKEFYTEAYFVNKKRADIFILDTRTAVEIACTEDEKSIMKKFREYPCDIEVVRI